jgi:putative polyketide hydroxylase
MSTKDKGSIGKSDRDLPAEIPVLIVGGGPVGLTTSLLLSHYGVRSLLVEQHPGTSPYPKARLINARTMEIFRRLGIEQAIHDVAIPHNRNLVVARTLAGEEFDCKPMEFVIPESVRDWSPTAGCTATQDTVEPVLLGQARRKELAQIRFNTQLTSFEQSKEHVLATLVHRPSGRVQQVRTQYLIGTDGRHSPIREGLGIHMLGQPVLGHLVNILFRADLSRWTGDREINICFILHPKAPGLLLDNGGDHWRFTAFYDPDLGQRPEDFTPERCQQIVRTAVGAPDLSLELGEVSPWSDAALVAQRFSDRRIFLAGDAAHVMSPFGGFAMNVGIQDAHNLTWKFAAVLRRWAAPALLETYAVERLPVSRVITEQMARNERFVRGAPEAAASPRSHTPAQPPRARRESYAPHGLVFGTVYDSSIIVPDGTPPIEVENPITDYVPNARPGSRAPHIWLEREGERISTLDLFGPGFVMLSVSRGKQWSAAAREIASKRGIPLGAYSVGADGDLTCTDDLWRAAYGIEDDGAVLVRPDGHVAWRISSGSSDTRRELDRVFSIAVGSPIA